jgi:hypothetical protein
MRRHAAPLTVALGAMGFGFSSQAASAMLAALTPTEQRRAGSTQPMVRKRLS